MKRDATRIPYRQGEIAVNHLHARLPVISNCNWGSALAIRTLTKAADCRRFSRTTVGPVEFGFSSFWPCQSGAACLPMVNFTSISDESSHLDRIPEQAHVAPSAGIASRLRFIPPADQVRVLHSQQGAAGVTTGMSSA